MQGTASNSIRRNYFLLITIVLIWGLSWPINKMGLLYVPPLWFAALRLVVGTVVMFILVIYLKKLVIPTRKDLPLILTLGFFQIGLFILFISLGLVSQGSGTAAILVYTTPLWVMPIAIFFFKEPNSVLKWLGFSLGLFGVLIMLSPWEMDWSNKQTLIGTAFLMSASLSMSISILCARYMTWQHTPLELIPWQLLIGSIMTCAVALILQPYPIIQWNFSSILCIGYTGIFASALGFLGMSIVSKELPATMTSIGFLGVPVSGLLFSVILLHEPLKMYMIVAMVFIISGLLCIVLGERKKSS